MIASYAAEIISKRSHKPGKSIFVFNSENSFFTIIKIRYIHLEIKNILDTMIASYVSENASKSSKKPEKSIVNPQKTILK